MFPSGNTSTSGVPVQGNSSNNSSSRRPEKIQAARIEARALADSDPVSLTSTQIDMLSQDDLLGSWASLDRAIDFKGSKVTEEKLTVLVMIDEALKVFEEADLNNGADYSKIYDEQLARTLRVELLEEANSRREA